jgi:predicted  nucleic acid-binding Zn-ribbon protein
MNISTLKLVTILVMALPAFATHGAEDGKEKAARAAREQARRTQQQVKALEAEKGQLAAEKTQLETELKAARSIVEQATRRASGAERARAELGKTIATMQAAAAAQAGKLADQERARSEAERKIAETERRLAEQGLAFDAEKRRLAGISAQQLAALSASRARNERMYALGLELVERYERKPFWTSALQAEPFTGLKRAQIEKMAEEEREKLDGERAPPAN